MSQNFKPLNLEYLKRIVKQESERLNLRSFSMEGESSFTMALALSAAMKKIFFEKSETTFSSEPLLFKKPIISFAHKLRVDAMEKFNSTTVFSVIHFAPNQECIDRKEFILTMIVYLQQKYLPEFLRLLKYPYIDYDDDKESMDGCGSIINLIGGQYKREMTQLGYKDLMMSPFQSYINTAPDGVGIPKGTAEKFELSFEIDGAKSLVIEMVTLDMLPKWKTTERMAPKKILIVAEDMAMVKAFDPFLKSQGFEVILAGDGKEGSKKLKELPHLIIFDGLIPVNDRNEFILEKRKIEGGRQAPIIAMTENKNAIDNLKIEEVREYLLKPIQPAALLKCIQRCIG